MKKFKWIFIILSLIITVSDFKLIYAENKQNYRYLYDYDDGIPVVNLNELEDENNNSSDDSNDYIDRDDDYDDEYSYTETKEERQKREAEEQERERKEKEDEQERERKEKEAEKMRIKKQAEKLAKKRKPIIEFAKKITKKHKSKKDKIKAIHDAICKHAKYDWELYKNGGGSSFYGDEDSMEYTNSVVENALHMLKKKKGVCGHYASLFTECCRAINIESEVVSDDDHAWSEVILDKKKYIVDVTRDDDAKISYSHFMIKEHPITKKLRDRKKYLETTKLPKYEEKFAKIDKMNIKNEKEYLQVMSYIAHNLEKGKYYKNLKLRVLDKKFNAYKHLNAVFLLVWSSITYGYDYKTRTYTFSFNYY